jgi:hypothetical protein
MFNVPSLRHPINFFMISLSKKKGMLKIQA